MKKIEYKPADSIDTASLEALDVQVNGELEIERLMIENADSFTEPPKSRGNSICEVGTPAELVNDDLRQPLYIEPQVFAETNGLTKLGNHETAIHLQEVETSG